MHRDFTSAENSLGRRPNAKTGHRPPSIQPYLQLRLRRSLCTRPLSIEI